MAYLENVADELVRSTAPAQGKRAVLAYNELKRRILMNEMPAGLRMLEQEAAMALDMSRTPVREALVRLQTEGLIEIRPRHGLTVLPIPVERLNSLLQLFSLARPSMVDQVASSPEGDDVWDDVISEISVLGQCEVGKQFWDWMAIDRAFQMTLVGSVGNNFLIGAAKDFYEILERLIASRDDVSYHPEFSVIDYVNFAKALATGDTHFARDFCSEYDRKLRGTCEQLMAA